MENFSPIPLHERGPVHPATFHPRSEGDDAVSQEVHTILVDNRDRAPGSQGAFDFFVDVQDISLPVLRHVTSITMKYCAIPKCADENYVVLQLCQGGQDLTSTDQACPFPSMVLFYDSQTLPTGATKTLRECQTLRFDPARSLSRLSLKLCKHGGETLTASDTANNTVCSFLLDITTRNTRW